jgi:hypothetical protein
LFNQGLKGSSIKVYQAAIRNLHVKCGLINPTQSIRLKMAVKGATALSSAPLRKQPITYKILCPLVALLKGRQDELMLASAMSLAFYGCFRAGELCVPDGALFDPKLHVCLKDVSFSHKDKVLFLLLKRSKTDAKNEGVTIRVGCSTKPVCAYCLMKDYVQSRKPSTSGEPLFIDSFGTVLKKGYFVSTTRLLLACLGYDPTLFSGHSYRAGCATTGADKGMNQWEIKMLGRWSSECYSIYLRNPAITATFAEKLAS